MTGGPLSEWMDRDPGKNWGRMLAVSLVLHALLFLLLLKVIPRGPGIKPLGTAYEVNLVSLSDGPAPGPAAGREKAVAPTPPAQPSPPVKAKPLAIPKPPPPEKKITPVPEEKQSLDKALELLKKKVSEEKNLERSFHRLENRVKNQELLNQALTRLEKKSSGSGKARSGPSGSGEGEGAITAGSPTGSPGVGLQFQIYHASLRTRIKKNWVLPEGLLKKTDLSADLLVRIARNGKIEDYRFERKSGVASFDQEVIRTLQKSDPLPPLPEGYPRGVYEVVLTFHSNDLGGN